MSVGAWGAAAMAIVAAGGCAKEGAGAKGGGGSASGGSGSSSGVGSDSGVSMTVAVLPAECAPVLRGLLGAIGRATRAMDASALDGGVTAWRDLRADCRGAVWYTAGAILLRAGAAAPLDTGVDSSRAALERGLAADPTDPQQLAYVAYLARVAPADAPALPADACGRATALPAATGNAADVREHTERIAYICGHALLTAKVWEDSALRFTSITDPPYPDVGVRIVQAQTGAGHDKAARAAAEAARATIDRHASRLGVTAADVDSLRLDLAASLK